MIIEDVCLNGVWKQTVPLNKKSVLTRAGAYFAEMKRRCNSELQVGKYSSYIGCSMLFTDFQEFASWATLQVGYGNQLDKDILLRGNKVYSADTCVFVPSAINNLLTKCTRRRGSCPIGVSFDPLRGFKVSVSEGIDKRYLGYYQDEITAFNVYKRAKEAYIKRQAETFRDKIDPRAYNALMAYEVLITD